MFHHWASPLPLGQWRLFGQPLHEDIRIDLFRVGCAVSQSIMFQTPLPLVAWTLSSSAAFWTHWVCVRLWVSLPLRCLCCLQSDLVVFHSTTPPVAWTLLSSVAPWAHWICVFLKVDPCHLHWSPSSHVYICLFVPPFLNRAPPFSFEAFRPPSSSHLSPEVPNTCIGGSGAGTLESLQSVFGMTQLPVSACFLRHPNLPFHIASAPKSHIGGSGMTASHQGLQLPLGKVVVLVNHPSTGPCDSYDSGPSLSDSEDLVLLSGSLARAPKSHIGGSGLTAVQLPFGLWSPTPPGCARYFALTHPSDNARVVSDHSVVAQPLRERSTSDETYVVKLLLVLGSVLVPLARGIVVLVLLGLSRLLLWKQPASSWLTSCLCLPFRGRCCDFALPLGNVARPAAILDWRVPKKHRKMQCRTRGPGICRVFLGGLCTFLGLPNLPGSVIVSFPGACWILSPTCAAGMAREGWPDDLPAPASSVPVFTPVITEGVSDAWSPSHDPERSVRAEDSLRIRELPWPADQTDRCEDTFLGCYVYTPHYHPVALAVHMPAHADLRYAMDVLLDCAPGTPQGLFNAMVPIHPQRVPGYLSVIRFPAHIRGVHEGYAAVICDLTRIGGAYFATVLPKHLSHDALVGFLAPLTPDPDEPVRVYVGCRTKLWPLDALVTLRDGDAIIAVRHLEATVLRHRADSLHDRANWGSMQQFFAPDFRQATCVLRGDQRFRIEVPIPHGIDLFDQVVTELQLDASRVAICSFPLENFEVHGTRCPLTVAVADVAAPTGGYREPRRQDFFVLCDLRPLGLKPRFVYAHLPRLHLPSLIADLGIALPAAFQVGLTGASIFGDVVHISCNCTLLFYAKEVEADDSVSITDLSPIRELPPPEAASPAEGAAPNADHTSPSQFLDPTIPVGHGWNLGADELDEDTAPTLSTCAGPMQTTSPSGAEPAPPQPVSWTYASYCTHMAGAWEELDPEEDRHNDAEPPNFGFEDLSIDPVSPLRTSEVAPVNDGALSQVSPGPEASSGAASGDTTIIALVLAPDYKPEYVRAHVQLPCGVEQLLSQVVADRYGPLAVHFPKLVPAVPQPRAGYLLFVSAPEWLTERPIVILDCQRVLQIVVACWLYPVLSRESLLVAAGLRHDSEVSVFVHGLLQPLDCGQRIRLVTGMVVSFAPSDSGTPATFDLTSRLQSAEGWDLRPTMPGPGYFPGQTFWVLTDSQPTRFNLGYRNRLCLQADLCSHLGSEEHRLSVTIARPDITDAFMKGHWTTNVVVATEKISTVPFPPARTRDTGIVLILDCRPLLLGFRWLLLQSPHIPVAEVTQLFHEHCPAEYMIAVTGCDTTRRDNDIVFTIQSGQVLVITLVEDLRSSEPDDTPPDNPPDGPPDNPGPEDEEAAKPHSLLTFGGRTAQGAGKNDGQLQRHRSRSPRGGSQTSLPLHAGTGGDSLLAVEQGPTNTWEPALMTESYAEDTLSSTPALTFAAARFRVVVPEALSVTLSALFQARPLLPLSLCLAGIQFSTDSSRRGSLTAYSPSDSIVVDFRVASAYEAARIAAARLGLPWPLLAPRNDSITIQDVAREQPDTQENQTHAEVTFLVLAPEYSPESVTMRIPLPHTVDGVLEQIDGCRSSIGRSFFPTLHPVHPQPDVRWGLVVATPSWLSKRVVLCLDLTLIDGRIFATVAPPDLDKHILLNMAGLSGGAPVEVYIADGAEPVEYGAELFVSNGDCISFVPAKEPLEFRWPCLMLLLAGQVAQPSHRPLLGIDSVWFPKAFTVTSSSALTGVFSTELTLPHDCEFLCKHFVYSPRHLGKVMLPSMVACAGRSSVSVPAPAETMMRLLYLIAALSFTTNRWLDVGTLRHNLSLAAPPGHVVELSGCCRHWNWLWLNPGQVVVVSYVAADLNESDMPGGQSSAGTGSNDDYSHIDEELTAPKVPSITLGHPGPQPEPGVTQSQGEGKSASHPIREAPATRGQKASTWKHWLPTYMYPFGALASETIGKAVKWSLGFLEHAKPVGHHDLTPVALPRLYGKHCKLLEEPSDTGVDSDFVLRGARTAARALGVGWPFPPYRWASQQLDDDGDDRVSLTESTDTVTDVAFYLLTPGFTGERVDVSIVLPQTVADALDLVQARRVADRRALFPALVPIVPQPDPGWGVVLAIPSWVQHRVIVCLDLSLWDGRIVPADVPIQTDYLVLCESAGLPPDTNTDLYLPGAEAPLPRGLDCQLWTGACVIFARPGSRRPWAFDLGAMLRSHLGWEQNPTLPRDSLDNGYCVVGPRGQCLFRLHADRARHYQSDPALLAGLHPLRIVLTSAVEQPMNVCVDGWECRAIVAATDRQERYDWHEGRSVARVAILDCRAALLGFMVAHTWDDWLQLEPIRGNLDLSAPDGWHTVFPQFPRHWTWTWLQSGQIILVAYEENASAFQLLCDDLDGSSDLLDKSPAESASRASPSFSVHFAPGTTVAQPARSNLQMPFAPVDAASTGFPSVKAAWWFRFLSSLDRGIGKWSLGNFHGAKLVGTLSLTPAGCPPDSCHPSPLHDWWDTAISHMAFCNFCICVPRTTKLLQDPPRTGTPADRAFDRARDSARLLGTEWPLPPYLWPLEHEETEDAASGATGTLEEGLYDLSFYLLTPDYTVEQLDLSVVLPQELWEALDLVQMCRQAARAASFPSLLPVVPQPDPGWGLLLAVPEWPTTQVFVCCDLSFYDGRIIAVCAPPRADSYLLCELVGLAPRAEVDIYLPYATVPLRRGEDCDLASGNLITFLRPGSRRYPTFDIHVMLSSHLGWEHSSPFPRDRQDNGYCVVSTGGQTLYRFYPERSSFYKADIALLVGLHPIHTQLTPAATSPDDVCVRGWTCHTVLVARSSPAIDSDGTTFEPSTVGLLDCRPLLGGWLPIVASEGWLDLTPIREMLQLRTPAGWQVIFPQLPSHWTWTCLAPGQIIIASLTTTPLAQPTLGLAEIHQTAGLLTDRPLDAEPSSCTTPSPRDPLHDEDYDAGNSFRRAVVPRTRACTKGRWPAGGRQLCLLFLILGLVGVSYGWWVLALLSGATRGKGGFVLYLSVSAMILHHEGTAAGMHLRPRHLPCEKVPAWCVAPSADTLPRPVATPCRNLRRGNPVDLSWNLGHSIPQEMPRSHSPRLITLLEECAERSWDWAFLASTLLDTLLEHSQEANRSANPVAHPTVLRLTDHLPPTRTFDLTALSVDLGVHFATAFELLNPGSWTIPVHLPSSALRAEAVRLGFVSRGPALSMPIQLHVYTDGSYDGEYSSWAFIVVHPTAQQQQILGWAGGRVITEPEHPSYVGADGHSAVAGEQCALLWATVWALQAPRHAELHFFSDCEVALRQATGRYGSTAGQPIAAVCRHFFQALEAARPDFVPAIQHVRSHTGQPANELVDRIARFACGEPADQSLVQCPATAVAWCRSSSLPWLWIAYAQLRDHRLWPTFTGSGFTDQDRLSRPPELSPTVCDSYFGLIGKAADEPHKISGSLCTFTLNTQTLADPNPDKDQTPDKKEEGFPGRTAFLREQFDYYGAHLIALQEARAASDGMIVSATHIRVFTGRDKKGNFGVELWLSRRHPFAYAGQTPIYFEPGHLLVLHASPRELIVKYCRGELRLLLVSVHAPTTACPHRDAWWAAFCQLVGRYSGGCQVLLLGDLNVHLADPIIGAVGDLVFPTKHSLPLGFVGLLEQHSLWVPSTFSHCHFGPSATWWPPTGGPGSRLDYVLIPTTWCVAGGDSHVFSALDWGQPHVDHFALRTFISFATRSICPRVCKQAAFDRTAMMTDEGRATLQSIFQSLPTCPWATNVHEHYAQVQQHLVKSLTAAFPPLKGRCRTSHFSTYTWQLRQKRVWLRKQVVRARNICGPEDVRAAWVCFSCSSRLWLARLLYILRHGRALCHVADHVRDLQLTKKQLRQAVRRDIKERISSAAATAHTASTGDVVSRLQSLLGPSARKARGIRQLPGLRLKDGTLAEDPEQMEKAWVEHFSGIEAGVQRTPQELAESCVQAQRSRDFDALDITSSDLPTLTELETAFRQTMLHRAFGTDQIPAEALHGAPGAAAKALYPVILKCAFRLEEPLHFKGGSLYAVWKGKATPSLCSSYRGILVSSTVGKAYHRILRARNVRPFEAFASPLQVGGLPKRPVTLAAHVVRLHQSWSRTSQASFAVLFLDLREAFYRIVRPLVTGFSGTDSEVATVLAAVQLPPGVMHELREHLTAISLFQEAGASPWTSEATCEALRSTWFRFERGSIVTETGIGTRPGDNLADIVFGFVFAKVLHQVRQQVERSCGLTMLPWHEDMLNSPFTVTAHPQSHTPLLDCTWMDDSALVLQAPTAEELMRRLHLTTAALLDGCLGRALLPNLDRGKTEAIVSLRGKGSRGIRASIFSNDPPTVAVDSRLWPGAQVQLVPVYRHLGGLIHHDAELKHELRHRRALAWSAFNKRRKKIFSSPTVAWSDKTILFESLVMSVLFHGAGTWPTLRTEDRQGLATTFQHMAFSMMRPYYTVEGAKRLGSDRALALLGLSGLDTVLHLARLRHLSSCVTVCSLEFWALAHLEDRWLRSVVESLEWLVDLVCSPGDFVDLRAFWKHWAETIPVRPGAWKRLLKKAQTRATRRESWIAAQRTHGGLLARQLRLAGGILTSDVAPSWECTYFCGPCNRTFPNKQSWSVHAFKTHGRKTVGRGVLAGLQCQCCLRHFGTNLKLCKHLAYSTRCRRRLLAAGHSCESLPGQGSRHCEEAQASQALVLQAAGPTLPLNDEQWDDEDGCPVAEVESCLAHLGFDGYELTDAELWRRLKLAFKCVCAATPRLRLTAESHRAKLVASDDRGNPLRARLVEALEWIAHTDLTEWLVSTPDMDGPTWNTFREGHLILRFLEVATLAFPPTSPDARHFVRVYVGPDEWCCLQTRDRADAVGVPFETCLTTLATGSTPELFSDPFDETAFVCYLEGWNGFLSEPSPCTPPKAYQSLLSKETLLGDLVRLALCLWGRGVPACLLFAPDTAANLSPLPEIEALEQGVTAQGRYLRNQWIGW